MGSAITAGCSFEFPRKDAPGGAYPATAATAKIVDDGAIHCFTTTNRRVQRNGIPEQVSLDIQWTVWIDGQEIDAGISKHTIYVTWAPPPSADSLKSSKLETIFNLGCAMADGLKASSQSEQDAVFNAIWAEFGDCAVSRMDGLKVGYYKNANPTTKNSQAYMLLADVAGDGQCNAFADLLKRTAALCGALSQRYQITAGTVLSGGRILVKNWTFGTGTVPAKHAPFAYRMDTATEKFGEVTPSTGIPGQGNQDPQLKIFSQHFVVCYGTQCYDPSYGKGPFPVNDISKWEAPSLEGVTKKDTVQGKDGQDTPNTEIARKKQAGDLQLAAWILAPTEQ